MGRPGYSSFQESVPKIAGVLIFPDITAIKPLTLVRNVLGRNTFLSKTCNMDVI